MNDFSDQTLALPTSRRDTLRALFRAIQNPALSTGARASLRRGNAPNVAQQAAFHRLLAEISDAHFPDSELVRWAAVAQCMTMTSMTGNEREKDGTVLARAGLSEQRFARLLASRGAGFRDQVLLIARYLHSRNSNARWDDLGELILTEQINEERADEIRLRLARDYYRAAVNRSPS